MALPLWTIWELHSKSERFGPKLYISTELYVFLQSIAILFVEHYKWMG